MSKLDDDYKALEANTKATERLALATEKSNRAQEKLNDTQRESAGLTKSAINNLKDWSNVLSSILKDEKYSNQEKNKALSINKKIVDLAEKAYTFDVKGLGTTTKSEKIQKQILTNQQNRKTLGLQINRIGEKGSEIQIAANEALRQQINGAGRVTEELIKQKEAADEIEGNKIANGFGVIGDVLKKIPLLSNLAPAFKEAEVAARDVGAEVTLFSKGMMDASDYTIANMAKMGPDAKVEGFFGNTEDEVKKLQKAADDAQKTLDKGGLKKSETVKLQKVVKKGGDAKVGKNQTLFGVSAQSALEKGTASLKGVNKTLLETQASLRKIASVIGKLALVMFVKSLFQANQNITDIQRNLAVGGVEARELNFKFTAMAVSSNDLRINLKSLYAASGALNESYGTALMFNDETLKTSARLIDAKILEGEAVGALSMQSRVNGKTMAQSLKDQEAAVNLVNQENNTRISLKGVIKASAKVQGQLSAQLGGDAGRISQAVTQAKALGMELKEVAAAGKQMLNFESSIEAELTAELMLGKSLNLEKARMAALMGDQVTLAQEISENVGDFGDFTAMNVLQQDSLAAAMGMTSDQLSNQLMKKANLEELAKEALERGDKQQYLDLTALSTQEKMEKLVLKVQDAFIMVASALEPITWTLGFIMEVFGTLPGQILVVAGAIMMMTKAAKAFKIMEMMGAVASIFKNSFSKGGHPIAALAISLGAIGALIVAANKMQSVGDVKSPADGKTQISTKEGGLFELSKNDDVAAGPGILDKLKGMASGGLSGLTDMFSGGIGVIEPLISAFNNLISTITNKFDLLINTITEKQSEGNNLQKSLTEKQSEGNNLQKSTAVSFSKLISTLALNQDNKKSPMGGTSTGMFSSGMFNLGGMNDTISADVISDTNTITPEQEQTISNSLENETSMGLLEKKLDVMIGVLQQKQNISLSVDNTITHDAWGDNKESNLLGTSTQERINNTSYR